MTYQHVRVDRLGDFTTITMDRPERRNALSLDHMRELIDAFQTAGESDARGVILAGNGPVFCSGHDHRDMIGTGLQAMRDLLHTCTQLITTMQSIPQPVVARVHGMAMAAGCQLVASADLAVAAGSAKFQTPGGNGGWFCTTPGVAVGRAVGRKQALELLMTGDPIDAATAVDWGLVNSVVPDEELDNATQSLIERATRGSALAKGIGKQAFYAHVDLDQPKAYEYAMEVMASTGQLNDAQEWMTAFLEKRDATYTDS